MATSPAGGSNAQTAFLKYTNVVLNTSLMSAPAPAALNENLLEREVFDYDFNRERIFLEIAEAEIEARRESEAAEARRQSEAAETRVASDKGESDDELSQQSAKLSLSSSSNGLRDSATKPRSLSDEDVAAAISASLREY